MTRRRLQTISKKKIVLSNKGIFKHFFSCLHKKYSQVWLFVSLEKISNFFLFAPLWIVFNANKLRTENITLPITKMRKKLFLDHKLILNSNIRHLQSQRNSSELKDHLGEKSRCFSYFIKAHHIMYFYKLVENWLPYFA